MLLLQIGASQRCRLERIKESLMDPMERMKEHLLRCAEHDGLVELPLLMIHSAASFDLFHCHTDCHDISEHASDFLQ